MDTPDTDQTDNQDESPRSEYSNRYGHPTGYDHVSSITLPLNDIASSGHSEFRVFRDWVDMALTSLMGDESGYEDAIDGYTRDEINQFAEAFGRLWKTTMDYEVDVLGDVYEAMGMASDNFAQHFTPHSVSEGMAELQTATVEESTDAPTSIADPACGSGRLLIAASHRFPDGVFFGQDKDEVCAKMTVVNFCLFNIEGYVAHGDTLTLDVYRGWQTTKGSLAGTAREIEADVLEDHLESMVEN